MYFYMARFVNKDLYSSIIKKVIAKELTQKEAATKLEITDRQVRRLIVKYKTFGNEIFIPKMNKRFSYEINQNKNMMKENPYTNDELNIIISLRTERTIDNASSVKYFNHYYLPIDDKTGEVVSFKSGTKCNVVNSYNNKLYGIIDNKLFSLLLIEQQDDSNKASKNGFTNLNSPWRHNMMLR